MIQRRGNPVPPDAIRQMFDRIAPVYDGMNTLMTAGLDGRWRRTAVAAAALRPGQRALDVACGTGRLTEELARTVGADGQAIGVDLSPAMLERARRRARRAGGAQAARAATPAYLEANALALPFEDASFDAATIAFGLRNLPDYAAGLAEMVRVVRPGGRVVVLEIAIPERGIAHLVFESWFRRVIPLLGRFADRHAAYRYLPQSLLEYPPPRTVAALLGSAGLRPVRWRWLPSGMATLHAGTVPAP